MGFAGHLIWDYAVTCGGIMQLCRTEDVQVFSLPGATQIAVPRLVAKIGCYRQLVNQYHIPYQIASSHSYYS